MNTSSSAIHKTFSGLSYLLRGLFLTTLLIACCLGKSFSQNTLIPSSGSNSMSSAGTLCTHAGCGSIYSNSINGYTVINGSAGFYINISGSYSTEVCCDFIKIYNGSGTGGTPLATYAGVGNINYLGTLGQTLTVQFYSDGSVTSTGLTSSVSYLAPPTITSFTPTTAGSGTSVTITGTNFTGATAVSFGGTAASSYSVVSATSITSVVGNGTSGSVSVTTPIGTDSLAGFIFPAIATSGTLTAFSSCAGTAASPQSFTASGSNLSANITVTAPTGFEVSTNSGSGYGTSLTLPQSGGTVASTTINVRTTAASTGSPSGNITLASTGATTKNVAASGTVVALPAVPSSVTATPSSTCTGAGTSSNLNATSAGNTINWYTDATGGTSLGSSSSGANYSVTPATTTTYYAEAQTPSSVSQTFDYSGSIVNFTVPTGVTSLTIVAKGAQGGSGTGGKGAIMTGTFAVTAGQVFSILAGQQPPTTSMSGGGGGTFVALGSSYATATPLIVAGGGGGGYNGLAGGDASTGTSGMGPLPGTSGNGSPSTSCGGGGGGFYSSGGNDNMVAYSIGGQGFRQGGLVVQAHMDIQREDSGVAHHPITLVLATRVVVQAEDTAAEAETIVEVF